MSVDVVRSVAAYRTQLMSCVNFKGDKGCPDLETPDQLVYFILFYFLFDDRFCIWIKKSNWWQSLQEF